MSQYYWLVTNTRSGNVNEDIYIMHIQFNRKYFRYNAHLSWSLFLYFNYLLSVTAGGPESPEGTCSQVFRITSIDSKRFESITIFCVKIDRNYNFVGLLHHSFWLYLVSALLGIFFQLFNLLLDLELPYTPPLPPRGIFQGYIFLKAYTKCYKISHVSTLAVGAFRIFGVKREDIMQKSLKIGNNF